MTPRCGCRIEEVFEQVLQPSLQTIQKTGTQIVHCPRHAEATVAALVEACQRVMSIYSWNHESDHAARLEYDSAAEAVLAVLRRVEGTGNQKEKS